MDKYPSAVKPVKWVQLVEAARNPNSPTATFHKDHTWRVTRIDFIFVFDASLLSDEHLSHKAKFSDDGLILLDAADTLIFDGLKKLVFRKDNISLGDNEGGHGLNQIIPQVFRIIAYNWSIFIAEAEKELERIVSCELTIPCKRQLMPSVKQSTTITEGQISHRRQRELSVSLHKFSRLWTGARSRIGKAAGVAYYIRHHRTVLGASEFELLGKSMGKTEHGFHMQ